MSNSALASGAGLRRVPEAGANGEGRTVGTMKTPCVIEGLEVHGDRTASKRASVRAARVRRRADRGRGASE
jgi:hypothetical protein